jgi:hypothetical protein
MKKKKAQFQMNKVAKKEKVEEKYTLFTNVSFAVIRPLGLRLNIHALLVVENESFFGLNDSTRSLIRGFGTEASADYFMYELPEKDGPVFEVLPNVVSDTIVMMTDDEMKPIFHGHMLKFSDDLSLFLQSEDNSKPLDVYTQVGGSICDVWSVLFDRVAQYWAAPFMPHSVYRPPSDAPLFKQR